MNSRAISWSICIAVFAIASSLAFAGPDSDGDGVPDSLDVCCDTTAGTTVDAQGRPLGDLDDDCDVDLLDYGILSMNFTGPGSGSQNGGPCDDGDACTNNDRLTCGACIGTPVDCNDENACTADACDAASGQCVNMPNDDAVCSDANLCTIADTCEGGVCRGTPRNCDDGNGCTVDSCDASSGQCVNMPNDGAACFDANPCTIADTCEGGVCRGMLRDCDDENGCTADSCDPISGQCVNMPDDDAACFDANLCTTSDRCEGGVCRGTPRDCNDENDCTADSCDPATGTCVFDPQDGLACDDGDICSHGDQCVGSSCSGSPYVCNDGLACTDEVCDGDGGCDVELKPGWCRIEGVCHLDGDQNPENPCLYCKASVSSDSWTMASGGCDDGDDCTFDDSCVAGVCQGIEFSCDDGRTCTDDKCRPDGTCTNTYDPLSGECFIQGACVADQGTNPVNECVFCDAPGTTWANRPAGTPCTDDGNPATVDVCDGSGVCVHR